MEGNRYGSSKWGNAKMTYVLWFIFGIISAIIINISTDYEKCKDTGRLKWLLGYVYKKPQYIVLIVLTPLAFLLIYHKSQTNLEVIRYSILYILLAASSIKDYRERLISNKLIIVGIVLGLAAAVLDIDSAKLIQSVVIFIVVGVILFLLTFATKGGVGMGDAKLIAVSSLYTGLVGMITLMFYSLVLSGLTGLVLLISKRANSKSRIPFAPFLTLGFLFYLLLM